MAAFRDLVAAAPTDLHRFHMVRTLATARRFREALDQAHGLPEDRIAQIRRDCATPHGKFEAYFDPMFAKIADLKGRHRQRELIATSGNVYRWRAFIHGDVAWQLVDALEDAAESATHLVGMREMYLAKLFLDPDMALQNREALTWFENSDQSRNYGEIGFRTAFARVALALYTDDNEALQAIATAMNDRPSRRGRLWTGVECAVDSFGCSIKTMPTQWLEPMKTSETVGVRIGIGGYIACAPEFSRQHGPNLSQRKRRSSWCPHTAERRPFPFLISYFVGEDFKVMRYLAAKVSIQPMEVINQLVWR